MNTPITASADDYQIRSVAQKLERDRAALMEALEECYRSMESEPKCTYWFAKSNAATAIAAARANFPQP